MVNLSYTNELRNLAFQLVNELISKSTAAQVFDKFIIVYNQLNSINENEATLNLKNQILDCMLKNLSKFPDLDIVYPLFLLDKNLTFEKDKKYTQNQIFSVKQLFKIYASNKDTLKQLLQKCLSLFEEINQYEIMHSVIFILSHYSTELDELTNVFDAVMKNIGDLNLELSDTASSFESKEEREVKKGKRTVTKTVILPDGSYGTVTEEVDEKEIKKATAVKYLRSFLLESNFYFAANLASSITHIVFKMKKFNFDKFKIYYYNALSIICAILKMKSNVVYKDPDNIKRIEMCLKFLLTENGSIFDEWAEFMKKCEEDEELTPPLPTAAAASVRSQVDDFLPFRHCKIFDPGNFDVDEDEENPQSGEKMERNPENFSLKKGENPKKFVEVLSGTEDPLFVEATVSVFNFDLSLEFSVKNKTKNALQNCNVVLFVPKEFTVIEKSGAFTLNAGEQVSVRNSVKFSKSVNAYIFAMVEYSNYKGENFYLNLSGIFVELMNTYEASISDFEFRKSWNDYSWEHNVMIVSRKKTFGECVSELIKGLKMTLVFPKRLGDIDNDAPFFVANLYTKTKLEEDALINISVERTKDNKIIGTCIIRSKTKDFMTSLGEKIKALIS